jgi:hypothetical protein
LGQAADTALRPLPALPMLLAQFRSRYPTASLLAELLTIHEGTYVVRALVQMGGSTLVSGMAAAPDLEQAEDRAKVRALETLALQPAASTLPKSSPPPSGYELQVRLTAPEATSGDLSGTEAITATSQTVDEALPSQNLAAIDRPQDSTSVLSGDAALADLLASIDVEPAAALSKSKKAALPKISAPVEPLPAPADPEPVLLSPEPEPQSTALDLSDVIAQTTVELKRLGWSNAKGREHLEQTYGKRSRQQLTDSELLDFLHYLESQPSPNQSPF